MMAPSEVPAVRPTPIYVAGSSRELPRVRAVVTSLEATGLFRITDRWFDHAEFWAGRDGELSREEQTYRSWAHERAIRDARVFWLLWPIGVSHGSLYELGFAAAHRWHAGERDLTIVVSGTGCANSIYTAHAHYRDESDALAYAAILRSVRFARQPWGGQ